MDPDQEVCLCFHVTRRKLVNFMRINNVQRASQLAECFGAGTGCGWCRPFLEQLFHAAQEKQDAMLPDAEQYARERTSYVRAGRGTPPPGATPVSEADD